MNFNFRIDTAIPVDQDGFAIFTGTALASRVKALKAESFKNISEIISTMGTASAKAQNLKQIITTFEKFMGSDNRLYLKCDGNKVLGMLRTGEKNLFYRDYVGNIKQIKPTCVLDFYVHESCQRLGVGKEIFLKFLESENKTAAKLAYDRPSEKLIGFLKKHFGLSKFIPQNNNYVIFSQYFETNPLPAVKETANTIPKQATLKTINSAKPPMPIPSPKLQQMDSLQKLRQEMTTMYINKQNPSMSTNSLNKTFAESKANPVKPSNTLVGNNNIVNYHHRNQDNPNKSYELNSPWADTRVQNKIAFRTTSNAYGSHYK